MYREESSYSQIRIVGWPAEVNMLGDPTFSTAAARKHQGARGTNIGHQGAREPNVGHRGQGDQTLDIRGEANPTLNTGGGRKHGGGEEGPIAEVTQAIAVMTCHPPGAPSPWGSTHGNRMCISRRGLKEGGGEEGSPSLSPPRLPP